MNQPGIALISPATAAAGLPQKTDNPAHIRDAAQQFEALLINQILHSSRGSDGSGWLSLEEDPAGNSATDFAEQQLADTLARQGGFGLAQMIAAGLQRGSGQ
jgi:Rod binding domain-containing protein